MIRGLIREGVATRSALCAHDLIANFFDENRRCTTMKFLIVNTLFDHTSDSAWHCNHPLTGSVAMSRNFMRHFATFTNHAVQDEVIWSFGLVGFFRR